MKTLVVYASKHGAAEECAKEIAKKVSGEVELVNLSERKASECSSYDRVVIGGSIYAGMIQKEVKEFCTKNLECLMQKKVGLFVSCMDDKNALTYIANSFPKELVASALVKQGLGGAFYFKKMNFLERFIIKMIANSKANEGGSLPKADGKTDISTLSEEKISCFVEEFNKA
jgi:menaquinone-dependent protoporphyrinogen oxidase